MNRSGSMLVAALLPPFLLLGACAPSSPETAGPSGEDPAACVLQGTYEFGWVGGMTSRTDRSRLVPPDTFRLDRTFLFEREEASCTTVIPACGAGAGIDVGDVRDALEDPDVVAAWTVGGELAMYGRDLRPIDVPAWRIRRAPDTDDGADVLVGQPCRGEASCRPIPEGLQTLHELLEALVTQETGTTACQGLEGRGGSAGSDTRPGSGTPVPRARR